MGFKVWLTNGVYLDYPQATIENTQKVVSAIRNEVPPDGFLSINTETKKTIHVHRRHITHIEET